MISYVYSSFSKLSLNKIILLSAISFSALLISVSRAICISYINIIIKTSLYKQTSILPKHLINKRIFHFEDNDRSMIIDSLTRYIIYLAINIINRIKYSLISSKSQLFSDCFHLRLTISRLNFYHRIQKRVLEHPLFVYTWI